jgi:hypothetical protein
MFVVPFLVRNSFSSLCPWKLRPIVLFLENHGKHLCTVEYPEEWLQDNGFRVKRIWTQDSIVYAEIDETETSMKDFYSFEQLTKVQKRGTEECWKTFFMMESPSTEKNSTQAWNSCFEEPIQKVLEHIVEKL